MHRWRELQKLTFTQADGVLRGRALLQHPLPLRAHAAGPARRRGVQYVRVRPVLTLAAHRVARTAGRAGSPAHGAQVAQLALPAALRQVEQARLALAHRVLGGVARAHRPRVLGARAARATRLLVAGAR